MLCAWNELILSFDCIEVSCADVFMIGHCLDLMIVVWCEDGVVQSLKCVIGIDCGWNKEVGLFDCMKVMLVNFGDGSGELEVDISVEKTVEGRDVGSSGDSGYVFFFQL